ncbi:MAG TPA: ABC transporter permease [Anaerolineales bacterium]|nr:ABC transporter permease [Anaerolineales bacterium]
MSELSQRQKWTDVIQPQRGWLDWRLAELWRARDLIMLFVWRDFVSVYKQTILGPLWYLIQPLLTTLTFTVIFGRIAALPTDDVPDFIFYLAGSVIWAYFAECLNKTSMTFISNSSLFGKVYFPRLAVPISILISNLIAFSIQFALFFVFVLYYWLVEGIVTPNWSVLLLPVYVLMMAGLGLGFGIIVSALTTRYRDLQFLVRFGVQLVMYATPVIYPLSSIPEKYQIFIRANPMTSIVEGFRYSFLGSGTIDIWNLIYSFVFMLASLVIGILLFNRIEATFMDTV